MDQKNNSNVIKWVSTKDKYNREKQDIIDKVKMENMQFNNLKRGSIVTNTPRFKGHSRYVDILDQYKLTEPFVMYYNLLTPWQGKKSQFREYLLSMNININYEDIER